MRVRKKIRNRKCWNDYCSGRSTNTKPSCNKTELNRNSKTEMKQKRKFLCHHQNCGKSCDQSWKETGEHRCSWGRETPRQLVGSSTGFPVHRIWYFCGWQPFRPRHRQNQLPFECRNWLRDRPPSCPNTGACLPATESKSDHLVSYRLTLISRWVLWWRVFRQTGTHGQSPH